MSTFLTQVNGFTPVIDAVVADAGLHEALVYGVVWRYCRMKNGICYASTTTIGNRLGISNRTVQRCMARLVKLGYLEDKTPGLKNRPHIYADLGLVKIKGLIDVDDSAVSRAVPGAATESRSAVSPTHNAATESHSAATESRSAATESRSDCDRESLEDSIKREDKREELREDGFLPEKNKQLPLDTIEWEMVKNELRLRMTAAVFDTWIKPTKAHRDGDTLVIQSHNSFAYEWLSMRLRPTIASATKDVCGPKTTIVIVKPNATK